MRRLPPLVELRAFEAAARHLSFERAAAELGVTPTAISHQIRLLEEYLGEALFHRRPRPLRLTEAGDMPAECFDRETDTCRLTRACRLKRALNEAVAGFYAALGRYTLEDVAIHPSKIIRLLR